MSMFLDERRSSRPYLVRALALAGVVAAGCLGAGCDDGKSAPGGTTGIGAGGLGGGGAGAGGAGGTAAPASRLAILSSDYATTSVSLYTPSSGALKDACITSATAVTTPLSGNVVLATQAQTSGKLVLLDGTTSVLTFVDPATCAATQLSVGTAGFKANPHDVVTLSSTKAYVTRYETNATPTATLTDFDEGDDLLIVDPTSLTVTGRIPLTAYATPGPGAAPTQARPDRAVLAGGFVYVTLNSIDATFGAFGAGRVVIVDPTTDAVTGVIDLPNQKDCSGLTYIAATKKLYVACGGAYTDATQVAESALVEVDLSGVTPVVGRLVQAAALGAGTDALDFFYAAILGDTAFVGTSGQYPATGFAGTPDSFYAVSLTAGTAVKLASGDAGNLGSAAVDVATNRVFLPDASATAPLVHIFDASGVAPVEVTGFEPNPSTHLPPRGVSGL